MRSVATFFRALAARMPSICKAQRALQASRRIPKADDVMGVRVLTTLPIAFLLAL